MYLCVDDSLPPKYRIVSLLPGIVSQLSLKSSLICVDGGGPPYIHHQEKPELKFQGEPLFAPETEPSDEEKETIDYEDHEENPEAPEPWRPG